MTKCTPPNHVWLEGAVDDRCECGDFTRADWSNPNVSRLTFIDEEAPTEVFACDHIGTRKTSDDEGFTWKCTRCNKPCPIEPKLTAYDTTLAEQLQRALDTPGAVNGALHKMAIKSAIQRLRQIR